VIALYAITGHPTPPLPGAGATHVVTSGALAAVCGPVITGEVTAQALWRHERIVEALMTDRDVLPVRYGTCLPGDAAAAQALQENHVAYAASLDAVRGAVELAVRVFPATDGSPAPSPSVGSMTGTEYLLARAHSAAEESDATKLVHEPLAGTVRAVSVARVNRAGELLRAAYLVDRDTTTSFSARVRNIQENNPQLRITCTGPWPPYSFVST
jgi:hypothetical protein